MTYDATGLIGPQPQHSETLWRSLQTNGFALDLSATGTGKTYCAASVAKNDGSPLVLICPKSVLKTWTTILAAYGVKPKLAINYELLARGKTKWMKFVKQPDPCRPHVPGATEKLPHFRLPKGCLVILDEGHRCKGLDTTNSQMLISLVVQKFKVLVASATAAVSPLDMKALGFLLQLHSLHDFPDFCRLHGAKWVGKWGAMTFSPDDPAAVKGMSNLHNYVFNKLKCASRMTREQFGNLFPESHIMPEAFDLGSNEAKIQKVYEDMEYELAKLEEHCANYREHVFAILMKARRQAEMLKVPLFCEKIEDMWDEGQSVAVFCNFTETIQAIHKRLSRLKKFANKIAFVVGDQTAKQREADIAAFQANEKTVILCNIAAGGVAISLHDTLQVRPRAALVSPTWSAVALAQSLGRVWRQGGSKSIQYIVYAAGCIEETICKRVKDKITMLEVLHDGELSELPSWVG